MDLQELAQQIAAHLPDWTYEGPTEERTRYATLTKDGAEIVLTNIRHKKRITVRGSWPDGSNLGHRAQITVAKDVTPERLAREIQRRLLPVYLPAYKEALEDAKKAEEAVAKINLFKERLISILSPVPFYVHKYPFLISFTNNYHIHRASIQVLDTREAYIEATLSFETMEAICRALVEDHALRLPPPVEKKEAL